MGDFSSMQDKSLLYGPLTIHQNRQIAQLQLSAGQTLVEIETRPLHVAKGVSFRPSS